MAFSATGFASSGKVAPMGAELLVRHGLGKGLAVDVGLLTIPVLEGVMVTGGVRWQPWHHEWVRATGEAGLAVGCGGLYDSGIRELSGCKRLFASGGYAGVSVGARGNANSAFFANVRYQLTGASPIPWSHWLTATGVVQINGSHLFLSGEAGVLYFNNRQH